MWSKAPKAESLRAAKAAQGTTSKKQKKLQKQKVAKAKNSKNNKRDPKKLIHKIKETIIPRPNPLLFDDNISSVLLPSHDFELFPVLKRHHIRCRAFALSVHSFRRTTPKICDTTILK